MMRAADHRKAIPIGVKLKAALLAAGFSEDEIAEGQVEFDHVPALARRALDENGEIFPPANDWRYLRPMRRADHAIKTRGRGATTAGSDVGEIAKTKRLEKMNAAYREILLRKIEGEPPPETKKRKRPWPSRPFPNQRKDRS